MSVRLGIPMSWNSMDKKAKDLIEKGWKREPLTREECLYLLGFGDVSPEIGYARMAANDMVRKSTGNTGVISSQIGLMIKPCPADCKFCNFGASHTAVEDFVMSDEELIRRVKDIFGQGDVRTLLLMTMHTFDVDTLKEKIKIARRNMPEGAVLSMNVGDMDYDTCMELKKAGAERTYHVCRIREGIDTKIPAEQRIQTIKNMIDAGFPVSTCTEPIGPEHSLEEVVNNFFLGMDLGCASFGVMKRVAVPGTPLSIHGQISEARLTKFSAVFSLASAFRNKIPAVNAHEPCQIGFFSGSNLLTAEFGGNPRDRDKNTEASRGMSVRDCRKMLHEAGFENLYGPGQKLIPLNKEHLL